MVERGNEGTRERGNESNSYGDLSRAQGPRNPSSRPPFVGRRRLGTGGSCHRRRRRQRGRHPMRGRSGSGRTLEPSRGASCRRSVAPATPQSGFEIAAGVTGDVTKHSNDSVSTAQHPLGILFIGKFPRYTARSPRSLPGGPQRAPNELASRAPLDLRAPARDASGLLEPVPGRWARSQSRSRASIRATRC